MAVNAALFMCKGMVKAIEVKSSRKMIRYLYLWYESVGMDLISVWISSKACFVHTDIGGKDHWYFLGL